MYIFRANNVTVNAFSFLWYPLPDRSWLQCSFNFIGIRETNLLEDPLIAIPLNVNRTLLVQADASSVEDGGGQDSVLDGGEPMAVKLLGFCLALVDAPRGVNELLYRDVAVAPLSIKVAGHGRRVFHAS